MIKSLKFTFILVMSPFLLWCQLYDYHHVNENGKHFFGLNYFPASWQSNVLFGDAYNDDDLNKSIEFNTISNALRLNFIDAEKMLEQFRKDYPNSFESESINFDVANFYFKNEKYRYALKWFLRVSENQVSKLERPAFNFNKGYTLFSAKRYKQAKPYLYNVRDNKTFESDAHYYLGHIAYQLEDFDEAVSQFSSISNPSQKDNLSYFQTDMNFRLGRFEKAIELGKIAIQNPQPDIVSEVSKIIGESYFNLEKYSNAVPYLESYLGKKGTWENNDFYQLGYALHQNGEYQKAIKQFNKIIGKKNSLAQNAYYILADCYIKTNQKLAAQNAFKSASRMNFNALIKEDSSLNYAKLSYEIGNIYENIPEVLSDFIDDYPKNSQIILLEELLVNSYTKIGNYKAALNVLDDKSGYKNEVILQRVLTLKGIQDFKSGLYSQSSSLFERSIKLKEDKVLEAYSLYWLGRSEYERNLFDNALSFYKSFKKHPQKNSIKSFERLSYDMAYVYFKLGEYDYALSFFKDFNSTNDHLDVNYQHDTFLRIGDCEFVLKKYWSAIEYYNYAIALNFRSGAYATYQKAISYGFVDRNLKKTESLIWLIDNYKKNQLVDDAIFELATIYGSEGNSDKAIESYDKLIEGFENSPYLARSILNKGLILYNEEQYDKAKLILEKVALKYRNFPLAHQAVKILKEISVDQSEVGVFSNWIKTNKLNTFTDIELEKTAFSAAEKQFIEGNFKGAEKRLKEYLENFPQGVFNKSAIFYLAEIYFEKELFDKALVYYESLIQSEISNYTEKAIVRGVTLLKYKNSTNELIPYLEKLIQIASFDENKRFASLNLMQSYYETDQFFLTIEMSNIVLDYPLLESTIKWDALKLKARSALMLKDLVIAAEAYQILESAPQSELVAEAFYFKADQLFKHKKYEDSIKIIMNIAANGSQLEVWNAKSLLLLAKNYFALEDSFQASFVLESLIDNFEIFPKITEEAKSLLKTYNVKAALENRSVNNPRNEN